MFLTILLGLLKALEKGMLIKQVILNAQPTGNSKTITELQALR